MFLARNRGKYVNFIWSNHKKDENKQFKLSFVLKGFAKWSPVTGNSHDANPEIKSPQSPWEMKQEYLTLCSYFPLSVPKWQLLIFWFLCFFFQVCTWKLRSTSNIYPSAEGLCWRSIASGLCIFACVLVWVFWCEKENPPNVCFAIEWGFFGKYKFKIENRDSTNQSYHNQYSWS